MFAIQGMNRKTIRINQGINMKKRLLLIHALFLTLLNPFSVSAGSYIELSPSLLKIDTPSASTSPVLANFRLGYAVSKHQIEIALMSGIRDDTLNQLTVEAPSVKSVFYHYILTPQDSLKIQVILGASQVDIEASYPGVANSSDRFESASYGIGLEESFKSIPQLKMKFDWIRLYDGDQLNINATSLGLRYEF